MIAMRLSIIGFLVLLVKLAFRLVVGALDFLCLSGMSIKRVLLLEFVECAHFFVSGVVQKSAV